jgi:hypothetical protein
MIIRTLPCLVCDKDLPSIYGEKHEEYGGINQPYGGVTFSTHGHFGSAAFDPDDGTTIEVNICDDCLKKAGEKHQVLRARHTEVDYSLWQYEDDNEKGSE